MCLRMRTLLIMMFSISLWISRRGHANCNPFNDVKDYIMKYIEDKDSWYYILRYNPDTRRMANAKGEIRIGASHQVIFFLFLSYFQWMFLAIEVSVYLWSDTQEIVIYFHQINDVA